MKKIIIIVLLLVAVGATIMFFVLRGRSSQGQAVLKVTANPIANVFLDNQNIGKTPLEQRVAAGEFSIKLIPETTVDSIVSWEDKIKLNPNLLTYVNRDLGDSELTSGGEILTLEQANSKKGELTVLSTPDGANVKLADKDKGATPLVLSDIDGGNYDLQVEAENFKSRLVKIKITNGYKLTASFQLAVTLETPATSSAVASPSGTPKGSPKPISSPKSSPGPSNSPKANATPPPKPYIEVLDTPTKFLNVRKEPSTNAEILTQVHLGEFYSLLDEQTVKDLVTGKDLVWYKITYESDKEGWVSSQYAKKVE